MVGVRLGKRRRCRRGCYACCHFVLLLDLEESLAEENFASRWKNGSIMIIFDDDVFYR